jgi:hypothetical protein
MDITRVPVKYQVVFQLRVAVVAAGEKAARREGKDKLGAIAALADLFRLRTKEDVSAGDYDESVPGTRQRNWYFDVLVIGFGYTQLMTELPHAITLFCRVNKIEVLLQEINLVEYRHLAE